MPACSAPAVLRTYSASDEKFPDCRLTTLKPRKCAPSSSLVPLLSLECVLPTLVLQYSRRSAGNMEHMPARPSAVVPKE